MLSLLHIENIALIDRADISFGHGFNVLTGETGAGKSIIIDAIGAVLGERTSRDLIRTAWAPTRTGSCSSPEKSRGMGRTSAGWGACPAPCSS